MITLTPVFLNQFFKFFKLLKFLLFLDILFSIVSKIIDSGLGWAYARHQVSVNVKF